MPRPSQDPIFTGEGKATGSDRRRCSTRAATAKRGRRSAAVALGALALTSGVTAAIDATSNGAQLRAGRLTIALSAHDGFKLDTCTTSGSGSIDISGSSGGSANSANAQDGASSTTTYHDPTPETQSATLGGQQLFIIDDYDHSITRPTDLVIENNVNSDVGQSFSPPEMRLETLPNPFGATTYEGEVDPEWLYFELGPGNNPPTLGQAYKGDMYDSEDNNWQQDDPRDYEFRYFVKHDVPHGYYTSKAFPTGEEAGPTVYVEVDEE